MCFNAISFSSNNVYSWLNNLYLHLSPLQKKVALVSLVIMGAITALFCCYRIARCWGDGKTIIKEKDEISISPNIAQKTQDFNDFTSPLESKEQDVKVKDNEILKDENLEDIEEVYEEKSIEDEMAEIDSEDDVEFFDAKDYWEDGSSFEEEISLNQKDQADNNPASFTQPNEQEVLKTKKQATNEKPKTEPIHIKKTPISPKEKMQHTFQTIWKHANQAEQTCISKIWDTIFQDAEVVSWKKSADKSNEYHLTLKTELQGTHPIIPVGKLILKKQIKIDFTEEKIRDTHVYRKIINVREGLCHRMQFGWLSKETALNTITIDDCETVGIFCTVEAMGQKNILMANEVLGIFQAVKWNKS